MKKMLMEKEDEKMEYELNDNGEKLEFFDGAEWHSIDKETFVGYAIGFDTYTKALSSFLGFTIKNTIEDLEDIMKDYAKEYYMEEK